MSRRLVIRGFFLGALLLCAGTWAASYVVDMQVVGMIRRAGAPVASLLEDDFQGWYFRVGYGNMSLLYTERLLLPDSDLLDPGWRVSAHRHQFVLDWQTAGLLLRGFAWRETTTPFQRWIITFPLWFPTGIAAGCLAIVWRKTGKPRVGRGFPV